MINQSVVQFGGSTYFVSWEFRGEYTSIIALYRMEVSSGSGYYTLATTSSTITTGGASTITLNSPSPGITLIPEYNVDLRYALELKLTEHWGRLAADKFCFGAIV